MKQDYLILKNISKSFPGVRALDSVSVSIKKGEVRALVGENGAGKSTLIKILSGAYRADAGEIILDGERKQFSDPDQALSSGIGAIYQEFYLIPNLSVAENITLGKVPKKGISTDFEEMERISIEVLSKLGVSLDTKQKIKNLTVAQQQIVEIAKVLTRDLQVLIMDEPTAALNETETKNLFSMINILKKQQVTILYISHRLNEVYEIADSVTVLKDGQVVDTKDICDLKREELVRMMIGRKLEDYYPEKETLSNDIIFEVKDLWFKDLVAGVNFQLHKGEILGIAGLEGQGQSELIRTLMGVLQADKGKILRNNAEVFIKTPADAKSVGIGYIPDDRKQDGLILVRSVVENLALPSLGARKKTGAFIDFKNEKKFVDEHIEKLSIKVPNAMHQVNNLSGGNQQKVVVGKWLGISPEVLIVSEPTRGIDVGSKKEIHYLMRELAKTGVGILITSCELPELLGMCDRILVMTGGDIVGEFLGESATEENIMIAATKDIQKN